MAKTVAVALILLQMDYINQQLSSSSANTQAGTADIWRLPA
jgi:hypothetical protein